MSDLIGAYLIGVASGVVSIIALSCLAVSSMQSEEERKMERECKREGEESTKLSSASRED